ncbi:hypothetical protein [Pseudomonas sp. NMI542_15]|uniref:hypothetical protein n=1 Tax=Pseudomonas sp. NMI542_15 TaxID=2903148 RepID=UPI003FA6C591
MGKELLEEIPERSFGFPLLKEEFAIAIIMINEDRLTRGGSSGAITELYVVPDKRSSGVAHLLISEGEQMARERGSKWRVLQSSSGNAQELLPQSRLHRNVPGSRRRLSSS